MSRHDDTLRYNVGFRFTLAQQESKSVLEQLDDIVTRAAVEAIGAIEGDYNLEFVRVERGKKRKVD